MATLTLGKSVTIDAVQSKKGDAVFVERRRRVVAPGSKELREEPVAPSAPKNAADEKLRAVLEAAKAREEERKKRAEEEAAQRAAREAEIERETREYEQVKEQLAARENVVEDTPEAPKEKRLLNLLQRRKSNLRILHRVQSRIVMKMKTQEWVVHLNLAILRKILKRLVKFHYTTL